MTNSEKNNYRVQGTHLGQHIVFQSICGTSSQHYSSATIEVSIMQCPDKAIWTEQVSPQHTYSEQGITTQDSDFGTRA